MIAVDGPEARNLASRRGRILPFLPDRPGSDRIAGPVHFGPSHVRAFMPVRNTLPPILRGEQITDLSRESRERLEQLAIDAQSAREIVWVRDECASRLKQPGATHAVEYLLAAACRLNGEAERAHQTCL